MRNFVLPYTSTMKTAADANIPMTAATRFSLNEDTVREVDASGRIIPTPFYVVPNNSAKSFDITGISVENMDLLGDIEVGAADLMSKLGVSSSGGHTVTLSRDSLPTDIAGPESYTMMIGSDGTIITGTDSPGLFHGLMSFIGLLDVSNSDKMTLKEMEIHDKPRFEYRGHQVDVARNFRSKDAIMKTIDAMALWKVRRYHS